MGEARTHSTAPMVEQARSEGRVALCVLCLRPLSGFALRGGWVGAWFPACWLLFAGERCFCPLPALPAWGLRGGSMRYWVFPHPVAVALRCLFRWVEKACHHADSGSIGGHAWVARFAGGGRALRHAGRIWKIGFISPPQHGQETRRGGFASGLALAPMSNGRPVWKAMRSRFALAAGWQNP